MLMTTGLGGDEFEANVKKWSDAVRSGAMLLQNELSRNTQKAREATSNALISDIRKVSTLENQAAQRKKLHGESTDSIEELSTPEPAHLFGPEGSFQRRADMTRRHHGFESNIFWEGWLPGDDKEWTPFVDEKERKIRSLKAFTDENAIFLLCV